MEKSEEELMKPLVGKTIASVEFSPECEGTYSLNFTDGTRVDFSSIGDDATHTTICIS